MSKLILEPNQPLIQWLPGTVRPGAKGLEREVDHSPRSSGKIKNEWSLSVPQDALMGRMPTNLPLLLLLLLLLLPGIAQSV
jgi:hypothetical protein